MERRELGRWGFDERKGESISADREGDCIHLMSLHYAIQLGEAALSSKSEVHF